MSQILVSTKESLRSQVALWRRNDLSIGFIPTMGALHQGHLVLIQHAAQTCDRVCVSIFVNPKQFGENEDFDRYPRPETRDQEFLRESACHLIYRPSVESLYSPDFETQIRLPFLSQGLCGQSRPDFFPGVAVVVTKLLAQVAPDRVVFGEKDFQQLQTIVKRLVSDLDFPVQVDGVPTVREADGLACSSRNAYLTPSQRAIAPHLYRILRQTAANLLNSPVDATLDHAIQSLYALGFDQVDYLSLCDANTLQTLSQVTPYARLFAAVYLGKTRLIDNFPLTLYS